MIPTLETDHLILRPFTLNDSEAVNVLASRKKIAETTLHIPHPYPEDGAQSWIATHPTLSERGHHVFAIVLKEGNTVIGD
ncbi:GNAT family N-acetyltransferase [Metabacillus herbersteinensis]|uniref:GNAT family N-acetyltransferase n=1 Tax=Metabacillus herbersteinensis TaxID=283816 RepID=A0ABV6GBV7_9BACI